MTSVTPLSTRRVDYSTACGHTWKNRCVNMYDRKNNRKYDAEPAVITCATRDELNVCCFKHKFDQLLEQTRLQW